MPRSRGGCLQCRSKHRKCDEKRPSCTACENAGLTCPGYETRYRWSTKHERPRRRQKTIQQNGSIQEAWGGGEGPHLDENIGNGETRLPRPTASNEETVRTLHWQGSGPSNGATNIPPDNFEFSAFTGMNFTDHFPFETQLLTLSDLELQKGLSMTPFGLNFNFGSNNINTLPDSSPSAETKDSPLHREEPSYDSSPSTFGPAKYLQTYYRLTQPNQLTGFGDLDFVQYYFKSICPLLSCFDSPLNPFRTLVAERWSNSATTYMTIQSMAIAHLVNHYPSLAPMGLHKRSQAWKHLQRDLYLHRLGKVTSDTVLLNLLLLGISAPWHQASCLGMQYLLIARKLVRLQAEADTAASNTEFFQQALMHWEMAISFVDSMPIIALPGKLSLPNPAETFMSPRQVLPHPWTGISTEVHFAFAEIGRILRRQLQPVTSNGNVDESEAVSVDFDADFASRLEDFLHMIHLPACGQVEEFADRKTPTSHLIHAAQAYRLIGLLEIYRMYPHLLRPRIEAQVTIADFAFGELANVQNQTDSISRCLNKIAKYASNIAISIPISSRANRLMALVLVASSSYMYKGDQGSISGIDSQGDDEDEIQLRTKVEERMLALSMKYPQRPQQQMLEIVKEVWQRFDDGAEHSHWLEVMHEKGWQTLMV